MDDRTEPHLTRLQTGLSRRELIGAGVGAAIACSSLGAARPPKWSGEPSCILLWMDGGPSHLDTFDPRPSALGARRALATRVPGLHVGPGLPATAERSGSLAVVRSMTSREGNHERASEALRTRIATAAGANGVEPLRALGDGVRATADALGRTWRKDAVPLAYGESAFGRGCWRAAQLADAGVRFVEVTLGGWDTHADHARRIESLLARLDPAFSSLLSDLEEGRLLSRTLVVWAGEFGRTPKVNTNEGRDHYPYAFCAALAGRGVRRGAVVGSTDERGERVVARPVTVPELLATVRTALSGRPSPGAVRELLA